MGDAGAVSRLRLAEDRNNPPTTRCQRFVVWRSTIKIMTYSASVENVKTVLQWLRSSDDLQWEDQTALLSQAVDDLEKMARPKTQLDRTGRQGESDFFSREAPAINAAMFDLIEMSLAMELGNREEAIESGEAALALLPEGP